jgi:DNA topoisomerase-1
MLSRTRSSRRRELPAARCGLPAAWRRRRREEGYRQTTRRRVRERVREAAPVPPQESAVVAGLRYGDDRSTPGICRTGPAKRFRYLSPRGRPIKQPAALRRIKALAIPPAWTDVWICPDPHGHLQATGRDARGRKQYRYHPRWREVRDEVKYGRLLRSHGGFRVYAPAPTLHCKGPGCRAKRCLPRSYCFSKKLSSASATKSTRAKTGRSG